MTSSFCKFWHSADTGGPSVEAIYRTLYESFNVNCLKIVENEEIKMVYLTVVLFLCVVGVSGMFQAIYCEFRPLEGIRKQPKLIDHLERPRNTQNT